MKTYLDILYAQIPDCTRCQGSGIDPEQNPADYIGTNPSPELEYRFILSAPHHCIGCGGDGKERDTDYWTWYDERYQVRS